MTGKHDVNRLDIEFNEHLKIKIVSELDTTKQDLQLRALEAILSDIGMDFADARNANGSDWERSYIEKLLREIGTFLKNTTELVDIPVRGPFHALMYAANRFQDTSGDMMENAGGRPEATAGTGSEGETLIQQFKRYYFDYRGAAETDSAFADAFQALTYRVIGRLEEAVHNENLHASRELLREYGEIRSSTYGSNDSVKERFEAEFQERT
ncbi:hypothetical protein [Paenibacillus gansuensis]|uniref:Uncharacterized protein n=1 Tax=Paenibacillus gansuensis TaxID=306542 RepID=A0ABW5P778_9BACL